jgi:hypothetical protein
MAQLPPAGQDLLFAKIRAGECSSYAQLRATAAAVRESLQVVELFGEPSDKPSEAQRRLARSLEQRFEQVRKVLNASTVDNEVVALKKINPHRAGSLADLARAIQGDLARIEAALRQQQGELEMVA